MDKQLYEIQDGVRRAKAASRCRRETIAALINEDTEIVQIPLAVLLSPKTRIEDSGPRGASWGVIYRMTQRNEELPPIVIVPGSFGIPVADVEVAEDELELFRQRYSGNP
jgi:hypothetical protein